MVNYRFPDDVMVAEFLDERGPTGITFLPRQYMWRHEGTQLVNFDRIITTEAARSVVLPLRLKFRGDDGAWLFPDDPGGTVNVNLPLVEIYDRLQFLPGAMHIEDEGKW
jgi:hypothetical protein